MPIRTASRVSRRSIAVLSAAAVLVAALLAAAGATAAPARSAVAMQSCGTIGFTPNSDDTAASIRTRNVSCRYARDFVRDSNGRPGARFRRFTCERRAVEPSLGLPYLRFQCVRGAKAIHWKRF